MRNEGPLCATFAHLQEPSEGVQWTSLFLLLLLYSSLSFSLTTAFIDLTHLPLVGDTW